GRALRRRLKRRIAPGICRPGCVEDIFLLAEIDLRLLMRYLEMIIAFLDHFPERHVWAVAMAGEVHRRHVEWIGLELERLLSAEERFTSQRIDFRDLFVRHRVTATRRAVAMNHQLRSGMAERAVIGVRISRVEREIIGRRRVHLRRRDRIETFRRLAIALADLRSETAGPAADRVGLQKRKATGAVLLPDFEL